MESLKANISVLVHAIVVVIRTLRDHRGCGDIGSFNVVFVADEGLRVKSEGIAHELGNSVNS
jgi:hypothetical protein